MSPLRASPQEYIFLSARVPFGCFTDWDVTKMYSILVIYSPKLVEGVVFRYRDFAATAAVI